MAWRDSLEQMKAELSQGRATRMERLEAYDQEVAAEREELLSRQEIAGNFRAAHRDERSIVGRPGRGGDHRRVGNGGRVEDELIYEDDAADVITTELTWDEGDELEVVVELAMLDEGISLMVNGVQIRQDRNALERALIDAFREQLQL